jgi:hypothetical protein
MQNISIRFTLLLFSIAGIQSLMGQSYNPVLENSISYFKNEFGIISSLRIDSVRSENGKQTYFTMPNIDTEDPFCVNPTGKSWFGPRIVKNNDYYFFFNNDNDSIKIKPDAQLNEKWLAYEIVDSVKIIAEVAAYDTSSFLGVMDSIKTIDFSVFNTEQEELDWEVSSLSIILSKNHGLIKTLNFSLFPNLEKLTLTNLIKVSEFVLVGLSNPELGLQNLTWFEAFDFEVDDELHETSEYRIFGPECPDIYSFKEKIDRYIEASKNNDSLIYKIERITHIYREENQKLTADSVYQDTIIQKIFPNPEFDVIADQPIISNGELYSNYMYFADRPLKHFRPLMSSFSYDGECGSIVFFDGCFTSLIYQKGLGGPYSRCEGGFMCNTFDENKLVYYKKGEETWGVPLKFELSQSIERTLNNRVFPNPTAGIVSIEIPGYTDQHYHLKVIDSSGRQIMEKTGQISGSTLRLDLTGNQEGLYLLQLKIADETEIVKLILQNQ